MAMVEQWVATAVLAGSAAVLAACGTTTTTDGVPPKPTTITAPTAVLGTACLSDQLQVVSMGALRGAGGAAQQLGFVNVSTSPCILQGWPRVDLLNAAGIPAAQATPSPTAPGNPSASWVTLAPGGTAQATVSGSGGTTTDTACPTYPWFDVIPPGITRSTPPGQSLATEVAVGLPLSTTGFSVCGLVSVSPLAPEGTALAG